MKTRPRFKPHFHVQVVPPDCVYLLSEVRNFGLRGRLYCLLAPLLDGCHTVEEVASELAGVASPSAILTALTRLEVRGFLADGEIPMPGEDAAFWSLLGVDPAEAAEHIRASRIAVLDVGAVTSTPLVVALERMGITVDSDALAAAPGLTLSVVLTDDYLQPALAEVNQRSLQNDSPWLLMKVSGAAAWFGPVFVPGETGCWQCLAHRLRANRIVESAIQRQLHSNHSLPTSRASLPAGLDTIHTLAGVEVAKWLVLSSTRDSRRPSEASATHVPFDHASLVGEIVCMDFTTLQLERHTLTRRPQCRACGTGSQSPLHSRPIVLESRLKEFTSDGGHRTCSPDETIRRFSRHISPITGVIRSLVRLSEPVGGPVTYYMSSHQYLDPNDYSETATAVRHRAGGKGKTDRQAYASALAESIERHCWVFSGETEVRTKSRYAELGEAAVHPHDLLRFSEFQYANRSTWNERFGQSRYRIPEPFDESVEIDWTPVWSLTHQHVRYVPTVFCYVGYPVADGPSFCWPDSNGNAAGNNMEEAILQGFLELVERDSIAVWWYSRVERPSVDLGSFHEPYFLELSDYYRRKHREFWVLDVTGDLGIPAFVALSRRVDRPPQQITMGYGAHLDPRIATLRAVTELNQANWQCRFFEDGPYLGCDDAVQDAWFRTATLAGEPYLAPSRNLPMKSARDFHDLSHEDLRDDVLSCIEIARRHGLETLVLDQTKPDIGMSVVKVIAPGLRHSFPRFAAGRLFDVPVRMGWLSAPRQEIDLNPTPTVV